MMMMMICNDTFAERLVEIAEERDRCDFSSYSILTSQRLSFPDPPAFRSVTIGQPVICLLIFTHAGRQANAYGYACMYFESVFFSGSSY